MWARRGDAGRRGDRSRGAPSRTRGPGEERVGLGLGLEEGGLMEGRPAGRAGAPRRTSYRPRRPTHYVCRSRGTRCGDMRAGHAPRPGRHGTALHPAQLFHGAPLCPPLAAATPTRPGAPIAGVVLCFPARDDRSHCPPRPERPPPSSTAAAPAEWSNQSQTAEPFVLISDWSTSKRNRSLRAEGQRSRFHRYTQHKAARRAALVKLG